MASLALATVIFVCCLGAALVGMMLHVRLPDHHRDSDSRDVVKLVMGLIATMAALVLSLLIASAKNTWDTQAAELQQVAADIFQLDQLLAHYGPEAGEARQALHAAVSAAHNRIWHRDAKQPANLDPVTIRPEAETLYDKLRNLSPTNETQRNAATAAAQLGSRINHTRVLMFEQIGTGIAWPFLAVLVFWVSMLFLGFGLFARLNVTVMMALIVGSLSVAGAIFLILELNRPYEGLMRISDMPLRHVQAQMVR